jgi:hypothetical protein
VAVLLIFTSVALPAIFRNAQFTENYDEAKYHLPAITQFATQLPHLDFRNYSSATTPLFHILFALLLRAGCSLTTLRLINFAISVATVFVVIAYLRNASHDRRGYLCYSAALLFATSIYVVGPAVRLTTDNLALGCAIGILYLLDRPQPVSPGAFAGAVLLAIIAVLTRQLYLWLVPTLFTYAVMNREWSIGQKTAATTASLLPLISILPLVLLWHGFTNSHFAPQHELHTSIANGKALVLALCILGAFAMVFASPIRRVLLLDARGRKLALVTFALAFAVLPMLGAQAGSYQVPMEGGWPRALAEHTPEIFHIWSLFWILFPLGCVVFVAMVYRAATSKEELLLVVGFAAWLLLNIMQARAMAKYYEPFEIVVVGRFAMRSPATFLDNVPVWMLTAVFIVVDIFRFWLGSSWASPGFSAHP